MLSMNLVLKRMASSLHRGRVLSLILRYQHCYQMMITKQAGADGNPAGGFKPSSTFLSPVFRNCFNFNERIALKDRNGQYTYSRIFNASGTLATKFEEKIGNKRQQKVAFLCPNDVSYVLTQWACWITGNIGNCIYMLYFTLLHSFHEGFVKNYILTLRQNLRIKNP